MVWQVEPVSPNHGKPVVIGRFESTAWLGDVMVWISGEAELDTVRTTDGWIVSKHYDLAQSDDLDIVLDELVALLSEGSIPSAAVTAWSSRT